MNRLAYFLFSTPAAVELFVIAAVWLMWRRRSGVARRTALVIALTYLVVSTYAVPMMIADLLARPFHRFDSADVPRGRVALVVFGAGDEVVSGWQSRIWIPNPVAASRVLEAVRVYQIANPEWVISSGGNPDRDSEAEPSSENMRDMLVNLGVPASRIVAESNSRETHENAQESAKILRALNADGAILVTSAVHMRRAVGAFRAAGWDPVPAIAPDPWFQSDWPHLIVPTNRGLYFSGEVVHELLGLPYYRMRGWLR